MARNTNYILYATGRIDPTYKNVWAFDTAAQRASWLLTKSPVLYQNNSYWRVGSVIKCAVDYESSFKYDYVEITNKFGTPEAQTWYCFITSRAYVSPNVTMFTLAVDYVQSFYFTNAPDGGKLPWWQVQGFVNRATHPTLLPPRGTPADFPTPESVCVWTHAPSDESWDYDVVIYSSIDLRNFTTSSWNYVSATIDGVYMAAPPYIVTGTAAQMVARISNLINRLNQAGLTDAITGIFLVPAEYYEGIYPDNAISLATLTGYTEEFDIPRPTTCGGYTPINSVLLGYDYTYFTVNNGQGEIITYNFEDFDGPPSFIGQCALSSGSPCLIMYPTNYITAPGGRADYRQRAIKITQAPSCSYLNDSYKIWLAQTQNSRAAAINGAQLAVTQAEQRRNTSIAAQLSPYAVSATSNVMAAIQNSGVLDSLGSVTEVSNKGVTGVLSAIGRGAINLISGEQSASRSTGRSFGISPEAAASSPASTTSGLMRQMQGAFASHNATEILSGIVGASMYKTMGVEESVQLSQAVQNAQQAQNALLASYKDKARIPATAAGSNAYGSMTALAQYGFFIAVYTPTPQYAEWIDKTLSAAGLTINQYLTVTRWHRRFDFVQIQSAHLTSDPATRPQFVRDLMISMLSSGVYLWYYYNGDISPYIGAPYGVTNEVI